jgi:putative pyrimidine permease RutG
MPPVVTGAVVAVIGLNLAPDRRQGRDGRLGLRQRHGDGHHPVRGRHCRLHQGHGAAPADPGRPDPGLRGVRRSCANGLNLGKPIDFSAVSAAAWFGLPHFAAPVFKAEAMGLIVPVAIILVAENLGHVKAVSAMTGQDLDRYLGRAFVGDGVATMVSGAVGGTGVTTYAENIGVMAVTRIYSTLVFVMAALIAIVLGFSPKFGALDPDHSRRPCWAACRWWCSASSPSPGPASGW